MLDASPFSRGQACPCEGPRFAGTQSRGESRNENPETRLDLDVVHRLLYGSEVDGQQFPQGHSNEHEEVISDNTDVGDRVPVPNYWEF